MLVGLGFIMGGHIEIMGGHIEHALLDLGVAGDLGEVASSGMAGRMSALPCPPGKCSAP